MDLPRLNDNYVVLRVDGKNFSKLTKSYKFDDEFNPDVYGAMKDAGLALVKAIDGAVGAYVVSDEVSVLIDMTEPQRTPWFDGRVEKILSVSASIATAHFNKSLGTTWYFDSKVVLTSASLKDVEDYFEKRHRNGYSNAVSSYATRYFGHVAMYSVPTHIRARILSDGEYPVSKELKHGAVIYRETRVGEVTFVNKRTGETETVDNVVRNYWCVEDLSDGTGLYRLTKS